MTRDYLSIPSMLFTLLLYHLSNCAHSATSVDVERVFSRGHILLSHTQNWLSVQLTRALICLGQWSLLGLVKDADVEHVTVLL
jgi:hypothetical protein